MSSKINDPVRVPAAVGVNVTETVQLKFEAKVLGLTGQLLVWAKSPLAAMLPMVSVPAPELVNLTVCGVLVTDMTSLPNTRAPVPRVTPGATGVPIPARLISCGLPAALSMIDTEP